MMTYWLACLLRGCLRNVSEAQGVLQAKLEGAAARLANEVRDGKSHAGGWMRGVVRVGVVCGCRLGKWAGGADIAATVIAVTAAIRAPRKLR